MPALNAQLLRLCICLLHSHADYFARYPWHWDDMLQCIHEQAIKPVRYDYALPRRMGADICFCCGTLYGTTLGGRLRFICIACERQANFGYRDIYLLDLLTRLQRALNYGSLASLEYDVANMLAMHPLKRKAA